MVKVMPDGEEIVKTRKINPGIHLSLIHILKEDKMELIVELIDRVLHDPENEANIAAVRKEVNALMSQYPLFAW